VWDREAHQLHQRTLIGRRQVSLWRGGAAVRSGGVRIEVRFAETAGIETISRTGESYAWTRKQGGVPASGSVVIGKARHELRARAVIDDSAGYHERHTSWRWSAGVGRALDGRELAWNLVEGLHDSPASSERTVWIDGVPHEAPPCSFDRDLSRVAGLCFEPEAVRERREHLVLLRSNYRQPFGIFSGELLRGLTLADGYGVMESHEAWW
jgi:hypothetical protein